MTGKKKTIAMAGLAAALTFAAGAALAPVVAKTNNQSLVPTGMTAPSPAVGRAMTSIGFAYGVQSIQLAAAVVAETKRPARPETIQLAQRANRGARGRGARGGRVLRGRPAFRGRPGFRGRAGRRGGRVWRNGRWIIPGIAAAIIGGAIANSQRQHRGAWQRCDDRYRSFRWSDGTFQPYGGVPRELCPYLRR